MAEFVCKVADISGRVSDQLETAQSEAEARQKLADRGFYVYNIRNHLDLVSQFTARRNDRSIRPQDFLIFNQQFNTLLKAGLPILKCLDLLGERAAAPSLRPIISDVRQRVRDGALLSEALQAQGSFPPVYVTAITAGERSGNLSGVLDQYISYLRVSTGFKRQLITALIYPSILVGAVVLVMSYMVTYAMPKFADLYKDLNVPLPKITQIVLGLAAPLRSYFLVFGVVVVVGIALVSLWTKTDRGALVIDSFKPRVWFVGDIWLKAQIAQFVRTLATLLAGGTPLVSALTTSSQAIDSRLIAKSVEKAAARVREGETLHASLAQTRLVPDLAIEMIEVGEASGALPAMLTSVADFYEEEVNTRLQRTLIWVSPAILVVMAVVIGSLLIALYLPMFSLQIGATG
ncbi:MAG TPA: type II secretion system F family protein [Terriglobales bacterium]|nr:type II secretion system F family protein [Terriglobales bacterium]